MKATLLFAWHAASLLMLLQLPGSDAGATIEQMMSAGKMMRDVCQPKFPKVTNEMADGVKDGIIPDDKDSKCYLNCVMEMMQTIKKGKFQYESTMKQIDLMVPDDMKDDYRQGSATCKNVATGIKNNCDAAHVLLTCLKANIKSFLFP